MKLGLICAVATTLVSMVTISFADEYVRGYTRKDGSYVQPYVRSDRDSSYNNNWSVQGNTNPYTGESGTKSPTWNDRTPSYNEKTYGNPGYSNPYSGNSNSGGIGNKSKGIYGW